MTKFRTLETEPLKIEDRDDVVGPPPRRTYRVPQALQGQLKLFCDEMVSQGWIQPSKSEWCSPVLILKKPNGGWRFLVDLRGVNARTKPISYYMPDMHECWQRLRNAKILSTCDLDRGYWQLNLDKESRMKTAFATPYGNFEYKVVPMALKKITRARVARFTRAIPRSASPASHALSAKNISSKFHYETKLWALYLLGCSNGLDIKCPLFSTGFGRNYAQSRHSI